MYPYILIQLLVKMNCHQLVHIKYVYTLINDKYKIIIQNFMKCFLAE